MLGQSLALAQGERQLHRGDAQTRWGAFGVHKTHIPEPRTDSKVCMDEADDADEAGRMSKMGKTNDPNRLTIRITRGSDENGRRLE